MVVQNESSKKEQFQLKSKKERVTKKKTGKDC